MGYSEKQLRFTFSGAASGTIVASGLRAAASIQAFEGPLGVNGQVRIWGLSLSQMNQYCSAVPTNPGNGVEKFNLVIEAGDLGGQLSKVIDGPIWSSFIDLTGAPDSAFNVSVAGIYLAATPAAPQSQPGDQNAEDLIAALCAGASLTLNNSAEAHSVLSNPSTYGSAIEQIKKIAHAARLKWKIEGTHVWLWPPGGTPDDVTIPVGPNTGMVGYPQYWELGIIVTSEFNQQMTVGRLVNVTSSIPKANGTWQIVGVQHELATQLAKGPWFTIATLAPIGSPGGLQ